MTIELEDGSVLHLPLGDWLLLKNARLRKVIPAIAAVVARVLAPIILRALPTVASAVARTVLGGGLGGRALASVVGTLARNPAVRGAIGQLVGGLLGVPPAAGGGGRVDPAALQRAIEQQLANAVNRIVPTISTAIAQALAGGAVPAAPAAPAVAAPAAMAKELDFTIKELAREITPLVKLISGYEVKKVRLKKKI